MRRVREYSVSHTMCGIRELPSSVFAESALDAIRQLTDEIGWIHHFRSRHGKATELRLGEDESFVAVP